MQIIIFFNNINITPNIANRMNNVDTMILGIKRKTLSHFEHMNYRIFYIHLVNHYFRNVIHNYRKKLKYSLILNNRERSNNEYYKRRLISMLRNKMNRRNKKHHYNSVIKDEFVGKFTNGLSVSITSLNMIVSISDTNMLRFFIYSISFLFFTPIQRIYNKA